MPTIDSFNMYDPQTGEYKELKVSTKFKEITNTVILNADSSFVNIGITEFNPVEDILDVVKNTTFINKGSGEDEYILNGANLRIENPNGLWTSGTKFYFRVLKNVDKSELPSYDPSLFQDRAITKVKLAVELQEQIDNNTSQLTNIAVQLINFNPNADGTTDDIASLQSAVNYIQANGASGTILLEEKSYYFSNFTFPDGISLKGQGKTTIIKSDGTLQFGSDSEVENIYFTTKTTMIKNSDGIQPYPWQVGFTQLACTVYFHNVSNVRFNNCYGDGLVVTFDNVNVFEFKNNSYKGGYSVVGGFQTFNSTKNGNVENNDISYSSSNGFGCHTSKYIDFVKNKSHHNGHSGWYTPYSTDLKLLNNVAYEHKYFDGFDFNYSADTMLMSDACRYIIIGNEAYNNNATGMYITGSQNIIHSNILYDNNTNGLRLIPWREADTSYSKNNSIMGNIVYNNNKGLNSSGSSLTHNILLRITDSSVIGNDSFQVTGVIEKCLYVDGKNNNIASNNLYDVSNPNADMLNIFTPSGKGNIVFGNRRYFNDNLINKGFGTIGNLTLDGSLTDDGVVLRTNQGSNPGYVQMVNLNGALVSNWQGDVSIGRSLKLPTIDIGALNPGYDDYSMQLVTDGGNLYVAVKIPGGTWKKVALT